LGTGTPLVLREREDALMMISRCREGPRCKEVGLVVVVYTDGGGLKVNSMLKTSLDSDLQTS
jgi:hypothetical protein